MSRTVKVTDKLEFIAGANQGGTMGRLGNVDGRMDLSMVTFVTDFFEDTLPTDMWATSVANGGAVAISAMANGAVRLTANAGADDNCAELIGQAVWYAQQAPSFECRLKVDNITTVGFAFGLFDNLVNTNDQIKCEISGTTVVDRGSTPTLVGFVFDTDATTDRYYIVNSNAGTEGGTLQASGIVPVNATYETFRIDVDASGNATYYRNGAAIGFKASAVATNVALAPYFGLITRVNGARNLDVDYVKCWQNRGETVSVLW